MPASSGLALSPVVKKSRVEAGLVSRPSASSLSSQPSAWSFSRRSASGRSRSTALGELVDLVVGDQPDTPCVWPISEGSASTISRSCWRAPELTNPRTHAAVLAARVASGNRRAERVVDQRARSWPGQRPDRACPCGSIDGGVEVDVELDVGLAEGRPALGDDREQQDAEQPERQGDGADAQRLERAPRGGSASAGERRRGVLEGRARPAVSRASGDGMAASVIFLSVGLHDVEGDDVEAERGDEQHQARARRPRASWRCRTPDRRPAA